MRPKRSDRFGHGGGDGRVIADVGGKGASLASRGANVGGELLEVGRGA